MDLGTTVTVISLIGGIIGLMVSFYKFSSSISTFSNSVKRLEDAVKESQNDRKELRTMVIAHDKQLGLIDLQFKDIKEDLGEIKKEVKGDK